MSTKFTVKTHTIPASYPREFPRATKSPTTRLKLVVNQYTPLYDQEQPPNIVPSNSNETAPGDLTIICTHGNAFHKELYEPFFTALIEESTIQGFRIRNIWAHDFVNQGASGVVNEEDLGDDPCWNDNALDIIQMVNIFAAEMPPPIIGIGHSAGGQAIFEAAIRNQGLFTAIIGIDPIFGPVEDENSRNEQSTHPAVFSGRRRDLWSSREEAEAFFRSKGFYNAWDKRVLDLHMKHGLRPLPTKIYPITPSTPSGSVTLTTTKGQEVYTFLRPHPDKLTNPTLLYRPEAPRTFSHLPQITIPILYVFPGKSYIADPSAAKKKMDQNPNNAELCWIKEGGHLVVQELPERTASTISPFLAKYVRRWGKQVEKSYEEPIRHTLSEDFLFRLSKL